MKIEISKEDILKEVDEIKAVYDKFTEDYEIFQDSLKQIEDHVSFKVIPNYHNEFDKFLINTEVGIIKNTEKVMEYLTKTVDDMTLVDEGISKNIKLDGEKNEILS